MPAGHEPPDSAEAWRLAWDSRGIDCDPVSSRVLVLNLRLRGDAACARLTEAAGSEPLWLTWRSLSGAFYTKDPDVFVCENPSVLIAAADELGARRLPLVCTNGRPPAAAMRLLTGLAATGATLHVRADEDPAGQEIAAGIIKVIPSARLWRFVLRAPLTPRYEEQDIDVLLHDLDGRRDISISGQAGSLSLRRQSRVSGCSGVSREPPRPDDQVCKAARANRALSAVRRSSLAVGEDRHAPRLSRLW